MLAHITFFTSLAFSFLYPLCFWLSAKNPLKNQFHHFHTALPNIISGILLVFILRDQHIHLIDWIAVLWFASFFFVTCYYWRKETVSVAALTLVSFLGGSLYALLLNVSVTAFLLSLLANTIFCVSLFAMNLGHWYLNVHGLPIVHLKRASFCLGMLISVRLIWDVFYLFTADIFYADEIIPVRQFMMGMEGVFLLVGIAFGVCLPLAALWMVREILKLKNTQATTGILYVVLCSIILADLTFKYYFFKYGILM